MQQQFQEPENKTATPQTRLDAEPETKTAEQQAVAPMEQTTLSLTMRQSSTQVSKWRRRKRLTIGISTLLFLLSFVCVVVSGLLVPIGLPAHVMSDIVILCALTLIGSMFGVMIGILMRPLPSNPANRLWNTDDIQAVGPLLEATEMLMPDVKERAMDSLIPLLERMQPDDGALLTGHQRVCLRRLLGMEVIAQSGVQISMMRAEVGDHMGRQRQFALAALAALAQIGTGQDLSIVQRLAEGKGFPQGDEQVRAAALACLPILVARADEERSSETYLRAAGAPASQSDVLLRAAASATETDPHQMLRASDREPN